MRKAGDNDEQLVGEDDDDDGEETETELATLQLLARMAEFDACATVGASPTTGGDLPAAAVARATGESVEALDANAYPQSLFAFGEAAELLLDVDLDFSLDLDVDLTGVALSSIDDAITGEGRQPPPAGANKACELQASELQAQSGTVKPSSRPALAVLSSHAVAEAAESQFMHRGRKNAKKELAYLREQVQALEQQLFSLHHPTSGALTLSSSSRPTSSSSRSNTDKLTAAVWEQIAQRQQMEKQKAEVENAKLREVLKGQLRVANSLEKILHKRPDASWLETFETDAGAAKRFRLESESERDIISLLEEEIADLYSQLDDMLMEAGLADVNHEIRGVQVKTDANDHMFMELVDSKILPFDLSASAAAVWKLAGLPRTKLYNGYYEAIDATDDTAHSQFSVTLHLRRTQVLIRIDMAIRKIVEASRVVLLWSSVGTSEGSLLGSHHQIKIREHGWAVVKARNEETTATDQAQESSLLQIIVRVTPELYHLHQSTKDQEQVGVLTDLIMSSYKQNMQAIHQLIENFLLSESMG